jgi:hypothetical protein
MDRPIDGRKARKQFRDGEREREREREQVRTLKQECERLGTPDSRILADVETMFGIVNRTQQCLLDCAIALSRCAGIPPPGRQQRRRRPFLILWWNQHYEELKAFLPMLVVVDQNGSTQGEKIPIWDAWKKNNPLNPGLLALQAKLSIHYFLIRSKARSSPSTQRIVGN